MIGLFTCHCLLAKDLKCNVSARGRGGASWPQRAREAEKRKCYAVGRGWWAAFDPPYSKRGHGVGSEDRHMLYRNPLTADKTPGQGPMHTTVLQQRIVTILNCTAGVHKDNLLTLFGLLAFNVPNTAGETDGGYVPQFTCQLVGE
eukprot:921339-Pelagomonas_calceolata.AAC.10